MNLPEETYHQYVIECDEENEWEVKQAVDEYESARSVCLQYKKEMQFCISDYRDHRNVCKQDFYNSGHIPDLSCNTCDVAEKSYMSGYCVAYAAVAY